MSTQQYNDYHTTCDDLRALMAHYDYQVRMTKHNLQLRDTYKKDIETFENNINVLHIVNQYITPLIKVIEDYLAERKTESMTAVNNAIRIASEIIPDAMQNVQFVVKGDEAWIQTTDGLMVRWSEGAGYKSILSTFLRSVTLNANQDLLQLLILDEPFAKVSVEYSATLSAFLGIMSQNMQIISIEQKPEIYANVDYTNYAFAKQEGYSTVSKEVVTNTA